MKHNFLLSLFCLLYLAGFSQNPHKNIDFLSKIKCGPHIADVEGYSPSNGVEYAIVGSQDSTFIVNVSNPLSPVILQKIKNTNCQSQWKEIAIYQNYAYIVGDVCNGFGIRVMNLSTLPSPVAYKDTTIQGQAEGHACYIDAPNSRLYVYGGSVHQGVAIYSLTNPWYPQLIGSWDGQYVHDAYVRNNIAYMGEIYIGTMHAMDFTNPASPVSLGSVITPDAFTHNTWLNTAGTHCFTTDEEIGAKVTAYDITNLSNIQEVDRVQSSRNPTLTVPHNVLVRNNYLVTSYYDDGVVIFDGDRPGNLVEVGYYDTNISSTSGWGGAWSANPWLPSGNILIGNRDGDLYILGPNYMRGCYLEGIVTDSITHLPLQGAFVMMASTPADSDYSASNGAYAVGVVDSGSYTVTVSKFGYITKTMTLTIDNGVVLTQDFELVPLTPFTYRFNVIDDSTGAPIPGAMVQVTQGGTALNYIADGAGQVTDTAFLPGNYYVVAGKWGWRTKQVPLYAVQTTPPTTIELAPGYYDDFYFDFGWTTVTTATSGDWERGEPVGTTGNNGDVNPDVDVSTDIGDQAYVTGNGGPPAGNDDVDDGETVLTTPSMNLDSMYWPVLRYYRWFANEGGSGPINDSLIVRISNGTTTVTLSRLFGGTLNSWVKDTFRIEDFITRSNNMSVSFTCGDYLDGHLVEGGVDQFEITYVTDTPIVIANTPEPAKPFLRISPNPGSGPVMVEYNARRNSDALQFEVHDLNGRLMYARPLSGAAGSFILREVFANGVYVASVREGDEIISSFRLVKTGN